jgi:flagellar hook-associated protein 2
VSTPSTSSSTFNTNSNYTLSTLTGSSTPQLTGLSSGLNTNQIIEELMAVKQQPLTGLENQQSMLNARNTALETLQGELQTVQTDATALLDPSLYQPTQSVSSSNSSAVAASLTSSNGAVEGGYEVSVTALAQSAQRTFTFNSANADSFTVDGEAVSVSAGESASDFAASVNSNSNLSFYATATQSGNIVLSERATGNQGTSSYLSVVGSSGSLVESTAPGYTPFAGQDAAYSIDNGATQYSHSDTVPDAIPGVTLTLSSLTGPTPATVNVAQPAVASASVSSALQQFISDYNKTITDIQTQLSTVPSDTNGTEAGTLYGDLDLNDVLSQMRSAMYATISGISGGSGSLSSMLDIGVSTGATTGSGTVSSSALAGELTLTTTTLQNALASDPTAVQSLLGGWANGFASLVGAEADAGGTLSERINGNTSQVHDLGNQITAMQSALTDQENQLVAQFAAMESALSSNSSESSWLTQQINALP